MCKWGLCARAVPSAPFLLSTQQAHIPNSIMTILEASGKQEPEAKEAPAGPLEEVRALQPTHLDPQTPTPYPKPARLTMATPALSHPSPRGCACWKGVGGLGDNCPFLPMPLVNSKTTSGWFLLFPAVL